MNAPRDLLLDRLVIHGLAAAEGGSPALPAAVLRLLLLRYAATGRADLESVLGPALGAWLDAVRHGQPDASLADHLRLSLDAAALSDDPRVPDVSASLLQTIQSGWALPSDTMTVATAMQQIEACLHASDREPESRLLASAIDELERLVSVAYRPGDGVAHRPGSPERGGLPDQVFAASALLAAYERTGRLPYSMLAEELAQSSRSIVDLRSDSTADFAVLCKVTDVYCRLAALHADPEYRNAAVVKPGADYAGEAARLATQLAGICLEQNLENSAAYGLVLSEWPDLQ